MNKTLYFLLFFNLKIDEFLLFVISFMMPKLKNAWLCKCKMLIAVIAYFVTLTVIDCLRETESNIINMHTYDSYSSTTYDT